MGDPRTGRRRAGPLLGPDVPHWATAARQRALPKSAAPRPQAPPVRLALTRLRPGPYALTVYRIGFEKNDAYTAYLKMGQPTDLSREQVADLKRLASGQAECRLPATVGADGRWEQTFPMREKRRGAGHPKSRLGAGVTTLEAGPRGTSERWIASRPIGVTPPGAVDGSENSPSTEGPPDRRVHATPVSHSSGAG